MSKLEWEEVHHNTEIGSTDNLCDIVSYETNIEIKHGDDVIFAVGASVFVETDTITGEQIITGSYSPQGEYRDVYIPLNGADTKYASIDEAKSACENKIGEILCHLYGKLVAIVCKFS